MQDREKIVAEVKEFKASRDLGKLKPAIRKLYDDTKRGENVSRAVVEAVKVGATIGEVVGTIRSGYDIHYDPLNQVEMPEFVRDAIAR